MKLSASRPPGSRSSAAAAHAYAVVLVTWFFLVLLFDLLVARLAVDKRVRGIGLGEALLMHALRKALDAAEEVGLWGVEVIAKDEAARGFYERYGFEPLVDDQLHLYVSVKTVRRAFR